MKGAVIWLFLCCYCPVAALFQCLEISWMLTMTNAQLFLREIWENAAAFRAADVSLDGRPPGTIGARDRSRLATFFLAVEVLQPAS